GEVVVGARHIIRVGGCHLRVTGGVVGAGETLGVLHEHGDGAVVGELGGVDQALEGEVLGLCAGEVAVQFHPLRSPEGVQDHLCAPVGVACPVDAHLGVRGQVVGGIHLEQLVWEGGVRGGLGAQAIKTGELVDVLPAQVGGLGAVGGGGVGNGAGGHAHPPTVERRDRQRTRLNSSH